MVSVLQNEGTGNQEKKKKEEKKYMTVDCLN